jgi:hypothetical protein
VRLRGWGTEHADGQGLHYQLYPVEALPTQAERQNTTMPSPALAQCCICRATTNLQDEGKPLPEGWLYRTVTVDIGRYYCPEHAHKA